MRRTAVVTIVLALVVGTLALGSGDAFASRERKKPSQGERQQRAEKDRPAKDREAKKDRAEKDRAEKERAKKQRGEKDRAAKEGGRQDRKAPPSRQDPPKERPPGGKPAPDDRGRPATQPMKLACESATADGQAAVGCRWSGTESPAFAAYRLWKQVGDDAATRHVAFRTQDRGVTVHRDRDVVSGRAYHYRIDALDRDGNVIAHSTVVGVKCCAPHDARPEMRRVRLECVAGSPEGRPGVGCRWSRFDSPEFGAYRLWRSTAAGADGKAALFTTQDKDVAHYLDRDVESGRGYSYAVEVLDRNGRTVAHSDVVKVACCADRPPRSTTTSSPSSSTSTTSTTSTTTTTAPGGSGA